MNPAIDFSLDDILVRFTDGGKMFVLDAISALSENDPPKTIWRNLKKAKPQIDQYVDYHSLPGNQSVPITDSAGWGKIQILLFDYLIDTANR